MKRLSGLKLLEEREGEGPEAQKGDRVIYNCRLFLNKGDEVLLNEAQAKHVSKEMIRVVDGVTLIDRLYWGAVRPSPALNMRCSV
jgi:hypothetical protein